MHFRTFLIMDKDEEVTDDNIGSHMEKYHQDNQDYFQVDVEIKREDTKKEAEKVVKQLIKSEDTTIEDLFNKIEVYKKYNHNGQYEKTLIKEFGYEKDAEGNLGNPFNPYCMYDWFVVGGRQDGYLSGNEHETDNGFNFSPECHTIENNTTSVGDYKKILKNNKDKLPFYMVSYKEDDYVQCEQWTRKDMIKFLKDYDDKDNIIVLDCHN